MQRVPDEILSGDFVDVTPPTENDNYKTPVYDHQNRKLIWVTLDEWLVLSAPSLDFSSGSNSVYLALI